MTAMRRYRLIVTKQDKGEHTLVIETEGESGPCPSRIYPSATFLLNRLRGAGALSDKAMDQMKLQIEREGDAASAAVPLTNDQIETLVGRA